MKNGLRTLALLAAAALCASVHAQDRPVQTVNVPLSRPGEPIQLDADLLSGEIHVIGEDRDDVLFEIAAGSSGRRIITPSGSQTVPGGALDIEIEERDNRVKLDSDWRSSEVVITARIPRQARLKLDTVHSGVITVRDVEGDLELENVHGPITATGIRGTVIAESVHGDIQVEILAAAADKPMALTSMHGNLELRLPPGHGAELHIMSQTEEIRTDFEVEIRPTEPRISRRGNGGRFVVEMDHEIVAVINGGGPEIKLETRYGDVSILKSAR